MKSSESIKYAVTFKFNKTIPNSMMQRMLYTFLARKEKKKINKKYIVITVQHVTTILFMKIIIAFSNRET